MLRKIVKTIGEQALFRPGDTVIVGISGGADSVALLDVLVSLEGYHLKLVAAHLNHLLRGAESDDDEAFVQKLSARYHVPCEIKRVDVDGLRRQESLSLEEAGRIARYEFLHEMALKHQADAIAIAHHADDQAETVLMRLIRGSAVTGLAAMAPKTQEKLVRPLLCVTRREIEHYLERRRLSYRNDSSNADTAFLRNRIRHELIPVLATFNPAIVRSLNVTAKALAADEAVLEQVTDAAFERHGKVDADLVCLSVNGIRKEPPAIRFRLYRRAVLQVKGDLARIGSRHLNAVDRLVLSAKPNQSLNFPEEVRAEKRYDTLYFLRSVRQADLVLSDTQISGPGIYFIPGVGTLLITEAQFPAVAGSIPATVAFFDTKTAPFPWVLRGFRPGDRIIPLGMSGSKKVKDIFIDAKVPRESRRLFPLLLSGVRLMWVFPLRVSEETRVTQETEHVLRAEILGFSPCIDL